MRTRNFRVMLLALITLCFMVIPLAGIAAEWKKVLEENGITGFTRPTPKSSIDEVMAVGMIDAPIQAVEAVIRDPNALQKIMFMCREARSVSTPEIQSTKDVLYFYIVEGMPFPVKDRDSVARVEFTIDKPTGIIYVHGVGIETDYEKNGKRVRMPYINIDYRLVPKGLDKTEFTYFCLGDPGGKLPPFLINLLTKNIGVKTIAKIREFAKRNPYIVTQAVVTTTPVKSHSLKPTS